MKELREVALAISLLRACGKTHALALAAKSIGATFIINGPMHGKELEGAHGIKTVPAQGLRARGAKGPYLIDHYAVECLLLEASDCIDGLSRENARLESLLEPFRNAGLVADVPLGELAKVERGERVSVEITTDLGNLLEINGFRRPE